MYLYLYLLSLQLELFSQRVQNNLIPLRHFSISLLPFRLAHLQRDSSIFYRGFFSLFMFWFFFVLVFLFCWRGFCQKRFLLSIFIESRRRVAHAERRDGEGDGNIYNFCCVCVLCTIRFHTFFVVALCVCLSASSDADSEQRQRQRAASHAPKQLSA